MRCTEVASRYVSAVRPAYIFKKEYKQKNSYKLAVWSLSTAHQSRGTCIEVRVSSGARPQNSKLLRNTMCSIQSTTYNVDLPKMLKFSIWSGVATIRRLLQIIGLFCRISSLLYGSFAKETYVFNELQIEATQYNQRSTYCVHVCVKKKRERDRAREGQGERETFMAR